MGRALPPHVLNHVIDLIMAEDTPAEAVARFAVLVEVHDRQSLRADLRKRLDEAADFALKLSRGELDRWPRFVARSLQEYPLYEVLQFLKQVIPVPVVSANNAAFNLARPLELVTVDKHRRLTEQYRLKVNPRGLYLKELLGEKTAETLIANPTAPNRTLPTPGAGTSRRLGRHQRSSAKSSASAFGNTKGLIPLGRSKMNGIAKSPITPASAKFSTIMKRHERPKTMYLDDEEAKDLLPPPSDTLRARMTRQEERKKKKEEEQKRKEARAEEMKKREAEKKRLLRERKQEITRKYRDERRYEGDSEEAELEREAEAIENEVIVVDDDDSHGGSAATPENEIRRTSSRTSLDKNSPLPKRARVPRRPVHQPRSGEEAYQRRARLSGTNARINELEGTLRPPQYTDAELASSISKGKPAKYAGHVASPMRPPPVFEPNSSANSMGSSERKDEFANVEFPQQFIDAVGDHRGNLSPRQIREILDFILEDTTAISALFRGNEDRKEYVLNEFDDYSLVLRLLKNGTWQRVRYTNV